MWLLAGALRPPASTTTPRRPLWRRKEGIYDAGREVRAEGRENVRRGRSKQRVGEGRAGGRARVEQQVGLLVECR